MICPYCEMSITNTGIEQNDGCCPHCGTVLDHVELDEEEEEILHEDDVDGYEERFGHPTRSYEERDVFDDFLEEEEDRESRFPNNDEE